jgi:hypothetical protein
MLSKYTDIEDITRRREDMTFIKEDNIYRRYYIKDKILR